MRPISELITERDMLDFSQGFNVQRNYLGSRLFPDQKTQYIEAEYSRIAASGVPKYRSKLVNRQPPTRRRAGPEPPAPPPAF